MSVFGLRQIMVNGSAYIVDLYNWTDLGDTKHFPLQGCVGSYRRKQGGVPSRASTATRLVFEIDNVFPLIPF